MLFLLLACTPPKPEVVAGDISVPLDECNAGCFTIRLVDEGDVASHQKVKVAVEPPGPMPLELTLETNESGEVDICIPPGTLPVGEATLTLSVGLSRTDFPLDIRPFGFHVGRERTPGSPTTATPPQVVLPETPFLTPKKNTWYAYQVSTPSYANGLLAFSGSPQWEGGSGHNPYHIGVAKLTESWEIDWISEAPVIEASAWDAEAQHDPYLLWDGSRYVIYYQGRPDGVSDPAIGRAFSTDGVSWETDPANPVYTNLAEHGASHVNLVRHDESLSEMWHAGLGGLGYALSVDDGASWEGYCANPVLPAQDDGSVKTPEVSWDGERYRMTFAVGVDELWRIGWAESWDGIRWQRGEDMLEPGTNDWDNEDLSNASLVEGPEGPSYLLGSVGDGTSAIVWAEIQ